MDYQRPVTHKFREINKLQNLKAILEHWNKEPCGIFVTFIVIDEFSVVIRSPREQFTKLAVETFQPVW